MRVAHSAHPEIASSQALEALKSRPEGFTLPPVVLDPVGFGARPEGVDKLTKIVDGVRMQVITCTFCVLTEHSSILRSCCDEVLPSAHIIF